MANVWCADDTCFDDLIFLGNENLIIDSPEEDKVPQIRDALLGGQSPAGVLGSDALNIPLTSVVKISTDRHDDDIEIEYKSGDDTKDKTLRLATPEKRDEVLAALKTVFGARFEEFEEAWSTPRAVFGPLMALTIFGGLTWLLAQAAALIRDAEAGELADAANSGSKALFAVILDFFGPTGVYVIGGLICVLCVMALAGRIKEPPIMVTLQEPPFKAHSTVKLIGKYILLVGAWLFVAKIALT